MKYVIGILAILALTFPTAAAAKPHSPQKKCHWGGYVTGGLTPNSPIVIHVTNSCVNNHGPQITRHLGTIQ